MNTITSSGDQRQFILVTPADPTPGEPLPILFLWHWIGGNANSFLERWLPGGRESLHELTRGRPAERASLRTIQARLN